MAVTNEQRANQQTTVAFHFGLDEQGVSTMPVGDTSAKAVLRLSYWQKQCTDALENEVPEHFDPYHRWLGIRPEEQPADHYRLLALARFEDDPEVIRDAAEQRIRHVRTYQLGQHRKLTQQILNELAAARACLLDDRSRAEYDQRLRQEVTKREKRHPPALPSGIKSSPASTTEARSVPITVDKPAVSSEASSRRHTARRPVGQPTFWRSPVGIGAAIAVGLAALVLVLWGAARTGNQPGPEPPNPTVVIPWPVSERTDATLWIDGESRSLPEHGDADLQFALEPGRHSVRVQRPGFDPIEFTDISLVAGHTKTLSLVWKPLPPPEAHLVFSWPLSQRADATLEIDAEETALPEEGDPNLRLVVEPGRHTVRAERPGYEAIEVANLHLSQGESVIVPLPWRPIARVSKPKPAPSIGMAFTGREKGAKEALLATYGGTATTEAAVAAGLEWLSKQQDDRTGLWSLTGPYSDGGGAENRIAATAMALLAFQGAGNTHKDGKYKREVAIGMEGLLRQQDEDGNLFHEGPVIHRLYTQAQATIAICELYGMTKDEKYRKPAQRALDYAAHAQSPELGGWRYFPQKESDTSVTGWFVMALKSGQMAELDVHGPTLDAISGFLDRVTTDGILYRYRPDDGPERTTPTMTAVALLCRQYLGWEHDDERLQKGVGLLLENPVDYSDENVYYWYYATQVMHQMGGEYWQRWNAIMRERIPEQQVTQGSERGSWDPTADRYRHQGGRLYTTCLSIYNLEVYYRHMPIYRH